jgi:hypothetical protein
MGSLRYPGGSTANSWNITSGRWVNGTGWDYKVRNEGLPAGTYTPKKFMAGIGGLLPVAPIWNLNMVTVPDPPSQLDELKAMGVPVEFVELGNENIDEPPAPYLARAKAVVARTRHLFPNATISVIGCFGDNWANCSKMLKQAYESVPRLFDAVTIHMYSPTNSTITKYAKTDAELRTATLAAVGPALSDTEWKVSQDIAATAPIWLDEFNWGGDWAGVTWPGEGHGALRGLLWATYTIQAMHVTQFAQQAGRSGFGSMDYYSLFFQADNGWARWASCASVSNFADQVDEVKFDGVSQIATHVNYVALGSGHTHVHILWGQQMTNATVPQKLHPRPTAQSCVMGLRFLGSNTTSSDTLLLNICPAPVDVTMPVSAETDDTNDLKLATKPWHFYSAFDVGPAGGWVLAREIGSLHSPPWINGPLEVHTGGFAEPPKATTTQSLEEVVTLPPLSLSFM